MESKPLFFEKQNFRQWWIYVLLLGLLALFVYGCIVQVGMGITFGDKPMSDAGLIVFTVVYSLFVAFFLWQHLLTKVDTEGIHYRFIPYHGKWRTFTWDSISSVEVKEYSPLSEYGGWGLRLGCVNTSGNKGMLIRFHERSSFMIGTQKVEELKATLEQAGKLKDI